MKFYCEQEDLLKALNIVSKGVSARTTLPILKGIKIECNSEKNEAVLTASDLELYVERKIPAVCDESGEIVVSAKLLYNIIRKINKGDVYFSAKEDGNIEIKNGMFSSNLQGIPAEEFPIIKMEKDENAVILDKRVVENLIRSTAFSASIEEARGIITGVLTEIKEEKITMVALDGFRMAIRNEFIPSVKEEKKMIISGRIMSEIGKILVDLSDDDDEDVNKFVKINIEEKRVFIDIEGSTNISARLMEGEFINYNEIIPKENPIRIEINRMELLECVDRASIIVKEGKNSFIKFHADGNELVITSRADEGTTRESIGIDKNGDDIEIGFNGRFVTDTLKSIGDEKIIMLLNTSVSPCLIKPVEGDSYEYLVLPVRLSNIES
jgi:DNA polymerase-3 subunit beta